MKQETYSKCVRPAGSVMARIHVAVHRASGGRLGQRWRGGEVGLLSTVGRRTGLRRTTPLVCLRDGNDVMVVASNGGSDRYPEWWLNLQHRPFAELELAGSHLPVVAKPATPDRQSALSARFCEAFPRFAQYRARTERDIPVIVLHPLAGTAPPGPAGTVRVGALTGGMR